MTRTSFGAVLTVVGTVGLVALVYGLAYGTDRGLRFDVDAEHALGTRGYDVDFFLYSTRIALPLAVVAIAVALVLRELRRSAAAAVALAGGVLSTFALKEILGRLDPFDGDAARGIGEFFPSTHTGAAASVGLAAVLLAPPRWRSAASVAAALYMAAVGLASVVAGGHYSSDVLGAYLICGGWAALAAVWLGAQAGPDRRTRDKAAPAALAVAAAGGAAGVAAVAFAAEGDWASANTSSIATLIVVAALCPLLVAAAGVALMTDATRRGLRPRTVAAVAASYVLGLCLFAGFVVPEAAQSGSSIPITNAFRLPLDDALATMAGQEGFCAKEGGRGYHLGQDFGVVRVPVRAAAAGRVLVAARKGTWDGIVLIEHRLGDGSRIYTVYGHLSRVDAREGRDVRLGQVVGISGPPASRQGVLEHLHFEVKSIATIGAGWSGASSCPPSRYLDPVAFVRSAGRR